MHVVFDAARREQLRPLILQDPPKIAVKPIAPGLTDCGLSIGGSPNEMHEI